MKRGEPLRRVTPLRAGKPLERGKPLARAAFRRAGAASLARSVWRRTTKPQDPALTAAKREVRARSGGRCEVGAPVCVGRAVHVHHALMRSQGGNRHDPAKMIDACRPCHDYVHAHPSESFERGWLLHATPPRNLPG